MHMQKTIALAAVVAASVLSAGANAYGPDKTYGLDKKFNSCSNCISGYNAKPTYVDQGCYPPGTADWENMYYDFWNNNTKHCTTRPVVIGHMQNNCALTGYDCVAEAKFDTQAPHCFDDEGPMSFRMTAQYRCGFRN